MIRLLRVLRGALRSASLLALLVAGGIALNGILLGYGVFRMANTDINGGMGEYGETLASCADGYGLTGEQERRLDRQNRWLMLLDGDGRVVWSHGKPGELPDAYSIADVAGFTRWYLSDYPVRVRTMGDGLLVLGFPKGSIWKYTFESPLPTLLFWPVFLAVVLLCNFLFILILSVAATARTYKRRDAARTEWIAAVSHDVRTPLAAVLGYGSSLERDPALPAEAREQAALIRAKAGELRVLIENLNLTNRLEHSMEPLQAEWLSLASVVREVAVLFLNDDTFSRYSIDTEITPSAARLQCYGDRALLCRMLKNLIGNSVRHNPDGCRITLKLDAAGRRFALSVRDDGAGFSEEQLRQLQRGALPLADGHGLGLAIVRQIVLAHHGRIRFSNGPEGGAACGISLGGVLRARKRKEPAKVE